jgi:hypothetical protein
MADMDERPAGQPPRRPAQALDAARGIALALVLAAALWVLIYGLVAALHA